MHFSPFWEIWFDVVLEILDQKERQIWIEMQVYAGGGRYLLCAINQAIFIFLVLGQN